MEGNKWIGLSLFLFFPKSVSCYWVSSLSGALSLEVENSIVLSEFTSRAGEK
jgi:hypothetical protein